eukprot:3321462-Ditylum_brightwellii.AAC.1
MTMIWLTIKKEAEHAEEERAEEANGGYGNDILQRGTSSLPRALQYMTKPKGKASVISGASSTLQEEELGCDILATFLSLIS